MIRTWHARVSIALVVVVSLLTHRARRWATADDRGDESIKVVIYAVLAVTLAAAVVAAITAVVNGKISLIK